MIALTGNDMETFSSMSTTSETAVNGTSVIIAYLAQRIPKYILIFVIVIWSLRIFVRNYLSSRHLAIDASERAILIETYLGLLKYPEIAGEPELKKQLMPRLLESIFRHSQDGIVKDDAFVSSMLEGLLNRKT